MAGSAHFYFPGGGEALDSLTLGPRMKTTSRMGVCNLTTAYFILFSIYLGIAESCNRFSLGVFFLACCCVCYWSWVVAEFRHRLRTEQRHSLIATVHGRPRPALSHQTVSPEDIYTYNQPGVSVGSRLRAKQNSTFEMSFG